MRPSSVSEGTPSGPGLTHGHFWKERFNPLLPALGTSEGEEGPWVVVVEAELRTNRSQPPSGDGVGTRLTISVIKG